MKIKKCRPVLVETKEDIKLYSIVKDSTFGLGQIIIRDEEECFYNTHVSGGSITTPWKRNLKGRLKHYQLILISLEDDKIEEREWYFDTTKNKLYIKSGFFPKYTEHVYKKVIAIQDQLLPEYIQQFVEQYNKSEVKDVEIEMEYGRLGSVAECGGISEGFKPKLTNDFVVIIEKDCIDWWSEFHPKSRYDMLKHCYPDYTGKITVDMIKHIKSVFENHKKQVLYTEDEFKRKSRDAFDNSCKYSSFDEWYQENKKR